MESEELEHDAQQMLASIKRVRKTRCLHGLGIARARKVGLGAPPPTAAPGLAFDCSVYHRHGVYPFRQDSASLPPASTPLV